jgi:hypothetical protein
MPPPSGTPSPSQDVPMFADIDLAFKNAPPPDEVEDMVDTPIKEFDVNLHHHRDKFISSSPS